MARAPRGLFGTTLLWTERDCPGLRPTAIQLGYLGPTSMSFLRLRATVFPDGQPALRGFETIDSRLSVATTAQVVALSDALPLE